MPTVRLPDRPDLSHLRRQARDLQAALQARDRAALDRAAEVFPGDPPATVPLSFAQTVVARGYGFASWPRLKRYVEAAVAYRWNSPDGAVDDPRPADRFCRLACLTYTNDDPARRRQARELLAAQPGLTSDHVWAAAAAGDGETIARLLRDDPGAARRRGGPFHWTPLFYLAYSRVTGSGSADPSLAVLEAARLLLAAGADPHEGYLWNGLPFVFTLLTGVFGEGEQGPERQPAHPQAVALARLLLAAGTDPNDAQTLYNRQFRASDEHLEVLFEYGLGTGSGGPWRARLEEALPSPAELLRDQLRWAIQHDLADRVRLLLRNGTDALSPYPDGMTPIGLARLEGDDSVVAELLAAGALPPAPTLMEEFIAAAMRADSREVDRLRLAHPDVVEQARKARPGLIVWAAGRGRIDAVALLADLGFEVNALARTDVPREDPWETALHHAAWEGDVALARLLLERGADPTIRDRRFDATPLGWAQHAGQEATVELLS